MMVPYILAAAATQAFSPVAGHAQNTRLQNTRVLRGGQAQASAEMSEAALAGLEPSEVQLATWLASDGGQSHLLTGWEEAAVEDKRRLLSQVTGMLRDRAGLRLLTTLCSTTSSTATRCHDASRPNVLTGRGDGLEIPERCTGAPRALGVRGARQGAVADNPNPNPNPNPKTP